MLAFNGQDALVAAIEDRHPRAAVHLLVIPHQHIPTVDDLAPAHLDLCGLLLAHGPLPIGDCMLMRVRFLAQCGT